MICIIKIKNVLKPKSQKSKKMFFSNKQNKLQLNLQLLSKQQDSVKIAFAFDLHGVVFRFSILQALRDAVRTKQKKKLLLAALNPKLIWDVIKLLATSSVVEKSILDIQAKYPNLASLIPLALQMANEQVLVPQTIELIRKIKKNGHLVFVFSNIGEQSGQILQNKYPTVFDLFDGVLFTSAQDNYICKPNKLAFNKFLQKFNLTKNQVILIDDKQANIDHANQFGIAGIKFVNAKQCEKLIILATDL
jgi:HAD superfamily hydrolase (TIGR01509 family)